MESQRLPPIPDELTSTKPDVTTKIVQTPDGRIRVHSMRQGVESVLEFQGDGSYTVHANTGSVIHFTANNEIFYHKGGFTLSVDNNCDVKMSGHNRINIDTDAHIEVAKNASIAVNGMADIYSTGHVKFSAADIYLGSTKGSVVINSARDIEMTATKGRITHHSSGVQTFTTDSGDFNVNVAGMVDLNSTLDTTINSQGKFTANSSGEALLKSAADAHISAGGSVVTGSGGGTKLEGGGQSSPPITVSPSGAIS